MVQEVSKIDSNVTRISILRDIKVNPKLSAIDIAKSPKESSIVDGVYKRLEDFFTGRITDRTLPEKSHHFKQQRKEKLEYAHEFISMPKEFGVALFFTDESKFNLFGSDGGSCLEKRRYCAQSG